MFGVYVIRNKVTGGIYVGSTTRSFTGRKSEHWSKLKLGNHPNRHLQASCNKHSLAEFEFSVLEEVCDRDAVLAREQYWLDYYWNKENCYNLSSTAENTRGVTYSAERLRLLAENGRNNALKYQKTYPGQFISPKGRIYEGVTNLNQFAKQHGLDRASVGRLIRGGGLTCKGWRYVHPEKGARQRKPCEKPLIAGVIVAPDGTEYANVRHAKQFCQRHGISQAGFSMLVKGKLAHIKGYTYRERSL